MNICYLNESFLIDKRYYVFILFYTNDSLILLVMAGNYQETLNDARAAVKLEPTFIEAIEIGTILYKTTILTSPTLSFASFRIHNYITLYTTHYINCV